MKDFDSVSMVPRLINSSKIKYNVLDNLFHDITIKDDVINLYIDGYYIFYKLYRADYSVDIYRTSIDRFIKETVISFLNTLAHYRRYITTRLQRTNRIFVINNRKQPKYQADLVNRYGRPFYEKLYPTDYQYGPINMIVEQAIAMAADLCKYFEDIFVIDSRKVEDHTAIAYLKNAFPGFNIYLSRNELMLLLLDDNSVSIYPKRDDSYLCTSATAFKHIFKQTKYKPEQLTAEHAIYYFILSGVKSRNVPGTCLKGSVKGARIIDSMIKDGSMNRYTPISSFIEYLPKYLGRELTKTEEKDITRLYKALDVRTSVAALTTSQRHRIDNSVVNLFDQEGLEEINRMMDRESDIINITDLNMNVSRHGNVSSWNWDDDYFDEWRNI